MKVGAQIVGQHAMRAESFLSLEGIDVTGADYSDRRLKKLTIVGSHFVECRFEGLRVADAGFGSGMTRSVYLDCSFDRSRIQWFAPGLGRFERCTFCDVDIGEIFSSAAEFVDCIFSGTIKKGLFWGSVPDTERHFASRQLNEFHGNDFQRAELVDVGFRGGVDLTQQLLPVSSDHVLIQHGVSALRAARSAVISWKDQELRRRAFGIIQALEIELQNGQQQLFVKPAIFFGPRNRDSEVAKAVFELLETHNRPDF